MGHVLRGLMAIRHRYTSEPSPNESQSSIDYWTHARGLEGKSYVSGLIRESQMTCDATCECRCTRPATVNVHTRNLTGGRDFPPFPHVFKVRNAQLTSLRLFKRRGGNRRPPQLHVSSTHARLNLPRSRQMGSILGTVFTRAYCEHRLCVQLKHTQLQRGVGGGKSEESWLRRRSTD